MNRGKGPIVIKATILGVCAAVLLSLSVAQALTLEEKVQLQLLLIEHVESATADDGRYVFTDAMSGADHRLYAANLHPKIMDFGELAVLCADFYDEDGTRVEVDFLAAPENGTHRITMTYIGQRATVLEQLVAQYGKPLK